MRLLMAASALALTMASAQAQIMGPTGTQIPGSGIGQHAAKAQQNQNAAPQRKVDEGAYNSALRNLPNKQYDPWHGVR